jgi:hypothetical protein
MTEKQGYRFCLECQERAEKAESECAALRAELNCIRAESELTETWLSEAREELDNERRRANYHQGAADNLRAEVESLTFHEARVHVAYRSEREGMAAEAQRDQAREMAAECCEQRTAAESRLAAATELLRVLLARGHDPYMKGEIARFLAAHPAAPGRCTMSDHDPTCIGCVGGTQDQHTCMNAIVPWPQPLLGRPDPAPRPAPADPSVHCRWHAAWSERCVWCHAIDRETKKATNV